MLCLYDDKRNHTFFNLLPEYPSGQGILASFPSRVGGQSASDEHSLDPVKSTSYNY